MHEEYKFGTFPRGTAGLPAEPWGNLNGGDMNDITFDRLSWEFDGRDKDPNRNGYRRGAFKRGWRAAVNGKNYTRATLNELKWQNLGWRLGKLLGCAGERTIVDMYEMCVRQQRKQRKACTRGCGCPHRSSCGVD